MNKERYVKLKELMEAIKDIDYQGISISDYDELKVTITIDDDRND